MSRVGGRVSRVQCRGSRYIIFYIIWTTDEYINIEFNLVSLSRIFFVQPLVVNLGPVVRKAFNLNGV